MPQLDQLLLVYQSQWFWLAITLGTIFVVVGMWIVPRVESTVDDRDSRIASDLEKAEALRAEADSAEEGWRTKVNDARAQAQAVISDAKAKVAAASEKRLAAADKRLAKKVDAAMQELDEARRAALAEIELVAADATREIVSKLTGSTVSDEDVRAAVAGAMTHA